MSDPAPAVVTGAEILVRTLVACGVDTCFTNPGTSEMHFVAALDRVEGMRCVLALFEGVARSEERRVGKECNGQCRSRWSPYH